MDAPAEEKEAPFKIVVKDRKDRTHSLTLNVHESVSLRFVLTTDGDKERKIQNKEGLRRHKGIFGQIHENLEENVGGGNTRSIAGTISLTSAEVEYLVERLRERIAQGVPASVAEGICGLDDMLQELGTKG